MNGTFEVKYDKKSKRKWAHQMKKKEQNKISALKGKQYNQIKNMVNQVIFHWYLIRHNFKDMKKEGR